MTANLCLCQHHHHPFAWPGLDAPITLGDFGPDAPSMHAGLDAAADNGHARTREGMHHGKGLALPDWTARLARGRDAGPRQVR
jgi:hypothetical protein